MVLITKDNGRKIILMAMEEWLMNREIYMKVNGLMVVYKVKEFSIE
jgi:hypothetical protein